MKKQHSEETHVFFPFRSKLSKIVSDTYCPQSIKGEKILCILRHRNEFNLGQKLLRDVFRSHIYCVKPLFGG